MCRVPGSGHRPGFPSPSPGLGRWLSWQCQASCWAALGGGVQLPEAMGRCPLIGSASLVVSALRCRQARPFGSPSSHVTPPSRSPAPRAHGQAAAQGQPAGDGRGAGLGPPLTVRIPPPGGPWSSAGRTVEVQARVTGEPGRLSRGLSEWFWGSNPRPRSWESSALPLCKAPSPGQKTLTCRASLDLREARVIKRPQRGQKLSERSKDSAPL